MKNYFKKLNPFKKKIIEILPEPKYKYKFIFGVVTKERRLEYGAETNITNPFIVKSYKSLWLWYHSRTTQIYIINSKSKNNLPVSNTISRENIIDIYTRYEEIKATP